MNGKIQTKLDRLHFVGYFTAEEAELKNLRLVTGRAGMLCLYWLVDETDGVICDAKFQAFGPPYLIVLGEIASELSLRKTYSQASRISADALDTQVRTQKQIPAFPKEAAPLLNQTLSAIDDAVHQCIDIPYAATDFRETPIEWNAEGTERVVPDWENLTPQQKLQVIHEVIEKEIQPYIALDAGGIHIVNLQENGDLRIRYEGSCTTCHSATGSTLSAIQQILQTRVHPTLRVVPEL